MKTLKNRTFADSVYVATPHLIQSKGNAFFPFPKMHNVFFGPATIQPKLKVGQPNDKYEQEADQVADAVMRMPGPQVQMQSTDKAKKEKLRKKVEGKASGSGKSFASQKLSSQIKALAGSGNRLPGAVQYEMGNKIGADFSRVNIHADSEAHQLNRQLGARAFTHDRDIYFNRGEYNPGSSEGKHLLAHELTHVVQQGDKTLCASSGKNTDTLGNIIQQRGEDTEQEESSPPTEERLDEIENRYRSMIEDARDQGYEVAADNLERFLAGTGGVKIIDTTWLRGFNEVTDAEETNQERFEDTLEEMADEMEDGEDRTFTDYWDKRLTGSITSELYYASGTSTITSTGEFTLSRNGDNVTIRGTVKHHWWDPYDWHAGLTAFIPGHGNISDADALLLQEHRGAGPFDMESDWEQTLSAHVTINNNWFNESSFTWSGP